VQPKDPSGELQRSRTMAVQEKGSLPDGLWKNGSTLPWARAEMGPGKGKKIPKLNRRLCPKRDCKRRPKANQGDKKKPPHKKKKSNPRKSNIAGEDRGKKG